MKPKLAEIEYFAVTTDLWTSRATHNYLSCTVHFTECSWKLQSLCLETFPLFEDYTGESITESLLDILTNWNLSPDQLIVTTTDGTNFVAGIHHCGWMCLSCFGHNLDLAIRKGLNMPRYHTQIEKALMQSL